MNWYKKISKIIEDHYKNYVSIGHRDFPTCIWTWDFPDNFQKQCWEKHPLSEDYNENTDEYYDVGHYTSDIWDGSEPYSGRFDPTKKEVSLNISSKFKLREIPELLLNNLYREFGPDIKIYTFK